jgi:hypothetical protein
MLALLIVQLQTLSEKSLGPVKNVVLGAAKAETALAMFAGAGMGSMLKTAPQFPLLSQMVGHLDKFQGNLSKLSQSEQAMLMDFLEAALENAI